MIIIGISGRIGAGKSLLANHLALKGGINLEVDEIGHKLLANESIKDKLVKAFGQNIILNNEISRRALGALAFSDKNNIAILNSIMHPAMTEAVKQAIKENNIANKPFILINAALLFSMKLDKLCDRIIYVDSSPETRLGRLIKFRNMQKTKATDRLFSQDPIPTNYSNINVIMNNGSIEDFKKSADKLFADMVQKD